MRNKDSAGYRGTLHDSPNRCCVLSFICAVNIAQNPCSRRLEVLSIVALLVAAQLIAVFLFIQDKAGSLICDENISSEEFYIIETPVLVLTLWNCVFH